MFSSFQITVFVNDYCGLWWLSPTDNTSSVVWPQRKSACTRTSFLFFVCTVPHSIIALSRHIFLSWYCIQAFGRLRARKARALPCASFRAPCSVLSQNLKISFPMPCFWAATWIAVLATGVLFTLTPVLGAFSDGTIGPRDTTIKVRIVLRLQAARWIRHSD